MRITSYGLFWRVSEIDWEPDSQRRLLGRVGVRAARVCNFAQQEGVYILYNDYGIYYVGLTEKLGLGWRLRSHHLKNVRAGKWDRFSWFGFKPVVSNAKSARLCSLQDTDDEVTSSKHTTIGDLEALLIRAVSPPANRKDEGFSEAQKWVQITRVERDKYAAVRK